MEQFNIPVTVSELVVTPGNAKKDSERAMTKSACVGIANIASTIADIYRFRLSNEREMKIANFSEKIQQMAIEMIYILDHPQENPTKFLSEYIFVISNKNPLAQEPRGIPPHDLG